jgi:hypothetical protein
MKSLKAVFMILALLALTGCVGAEKVALDSATETSVVESLPTDTVTAPTQEIAPQDEGAPEIEETPQDELEDTGGEATPVSDMQTASECTLVSSLPDPPEEYAELFSVQEDDWVVGPDNAVVTLIEYGDFQ